MVKISVKLKSTILFLIFMYFIAVQPTSIEAKDIDGFEKLDWGATAEQIKAEYGQPKKGEPAGPRERALMKTKGIIPNPEPSVQGFLSSQQRSFNRFLHRDNDLLLYEDKTYKGFKADIHFFVDSDNGLQKVAVALNRKAKEEDLPNAKDQKNCLNILKSLRPELSDTYNPLLAIETDYSSSTNYYDSCRALDQFHNLTLPNTNTDDSRWSEAKEKHKGYFKTVWGITDLSNPTVSFDQEVVKSYPGWQISWIDVNNGSNVTLFNRSSAHGRIIEVHYNSPEW